MELYSSDWHKILWAKSMCKLHCLLTFDSKCVEIIGKNKYKHRYMITSQRLMWEPVPSSPDSSPICRLGSALVSWIYQEDRCLLSVWNLSEEGQRSNKRFNANPLFDMYKKNKRFLGLSLAWCSQLGEAGEELHSTVIPLPCSLSCPCSSFLQFFISGYQPEKPPYKLELTPHVAG